VSLSSLGTAPGQIYRHPSFYRDESGRWQPKYLLVLGQSIAGDIVFRTLTSKSHARPENPRCYHGNPRPGYFLGVLGGRLSANSWVDLGPDNDYDSVQFQEMMELGQLELEKTLEKAVICDVLLCAVNAPDTTGYQSEAIWSSRSALGC
jgi:hypothetical protein